VSAKAEREAEQDRTTARRELAQATVDEISINAKATKGAKLVEADGFCTVNAADSLVSAEILAFRLNGLRLDALPATFEAMMLPAEKIDRITMMNVGGFGGAGGTAPAPAASSPLNGNPDA